MADVKISALPAAGSALGTDEYPVNQGGTTKKVTAAQIAAYINAGTVTSVGLSLPGIFSVSGSPVTTSGTLSATLASQSQNLVFASPNGSSGAPTFRALVSADIPSLSGSYANLALSNLASTAVNVDVNPGISNNVNLGSTIFRWASLNATTITSGNQEINMARSRTTPSGATSVGSIYAVFLGDKIGMFTANDAFPDASKTGNLYLETGNKTAGTGNSGDINIQTGTSAGGTRGSISLNGFFVSFTGDLLPASNNTLNIGNATHKIQNMDISTISNSGQPVINVNSGTILDLSSGLQSIDFNSRVLYHSDGSTAAVDWQNGIIRDAAAQIAINWESRSFADTSGNLSTDFAARHLANSSEVTTLDWENQFLKDPTSSNQALNWANRQLVNASGVSVLGWGSNINILDVHLLSSIAIGSPPSAAPNANAGTGASAGVSNATDVSGEVSLTTGSGAWASGAQVTVTFAVSYGAAPKISLTPTNSNAGIASPNVYVTKTANDFTINFINPDAASTAYTWDYSVIGSS